MAFVELELDRSGHELLRRVDGGLQHLALGREPEAVVDQLGVFRHELVLEVGCAASRMVPPGVSYMPRDFMPTKRFSTRSSRPMPWARPSALRPASTFAGESRWPSSAIASPRSNSTST